MNHSNKIGKASQVFSKVTTEAIKNAFYKMSLDSRFKELDKKMREDMIQILINEVNTTVSLTLPSFIKGITSIVDDVVAETTRTLSSKTKK